MIILFGSYARNTWVEDPIGEQDGVMRYHYQSDFDILVILATKSEFAQNAAFLLHQVTERLYTAILLVFTRYKPATTDIDMLRKLINSLDERFVGIFPMSTSEDRQLFKLLRKAYVDARYNRNYKITHDELQQLANYVTELIQITETACREKIESFVA